MPNRATYQPEIDGLRAIAVLTVVLYHVGIEHFSGGYVGVDVFFVISGFLITRLIVQEVEANGDFSFGRFYLRRIRRLFPALLTTTVVSFLLASALLSPEQMTDFSASAMTATLSVSNFWFWSQADYFDALALTKPLLHTWSLSVEEQFYLVWPAVIVLLLHRFGTKTLIISLSAACLLSLGLAEYLLIGDPSAAFYLLPPRIMELGIGALMVWIVQNRIRSPLLLNLIGVAGIVLIAGSVICFTDETPFPGIAALIPCAGTAMVIYARDAGFIGYLLRYRVALLIGRSSYSIYLVHWPMLVFFYAYSYSEPDVLQQVMLIAASVIVGWMQFRFVELRFRYAGSPRMENTRFLAGAGGGALLVIVVSYYGFASGGIPERIPDKRLSLTDREWRAKQAEYCENYQPGKSKELYTCQIYRNSGQQIVLWGDSHALHLAPGFAEAYPDYDVYVMYMSGCVPQSGFAGYVRENSSAEECLQRNRRIFEHLIGQEPTNVILTSAKRSNPEVIAEATTEIVQPLLGAGHRVVVLGDFIRPGVPLRECGSRPAVLFSDDDIALQCSGDKRTAEKELRYNRRLLKHYPTAIMPDDIQCPNGKCIFYADGHLLYRDHHHLNVIGSTYFVEKMKGKLPL